MVKINQLSKLLVFLTTIFLFSTLTLAWTGIPPTSVIAYGSASINGAQATAGSTIRVYEMDDGYQLLGSSIVTSPGYFPAIIMPWDDPDTVSVDEGMDYVYPKRLAFQINSEWVEFVYENNPSMSAGYISPHGYVSLDDNSFEGLPFEVNLTKVINYQPIIYVDDQVVVQGQTINFPVTAWDNTSFRTDTLTMSASSSVFLSQTKFDSIAEATASFTPTCQQACSQAILPTFYVSDDGRPSESDSKQIRINITNVNDNPSISNGNIVYLINDLNTFNLKNALSYSDCDSCFADTSYFELISVADPDATFNIIDPNTGEASIISSEEGIYTYTIRVTDGAGLTSEADLTIQIRKVEDLVVVKNIVAQDLNTYDVEVSIYNYNFLGLDLYNIELNDSDVGFHIFNLTYRNRTDFTRTITVLQEELYEFPYAKAYSSQLGVNHYSNQPTIFVGKKSGGGGGNNDPECPTNFCYYSWECTEWSECEGNEDSGNADISNEARQSRICINTGTCSGSKGKPNEVQKCSIKPEKEPKTIIEKEFVYLDGERLSPESQDPIYLAYASAALGALGIFFIPILALTLRTKSITIVSKDENMANVLQYSFKKHIEDKNLKKEKIKAYTIFSLDDRNLSKDMEEHFKKHEIKKYHKKLKVADLKVLKRSKKIIVDNLSIKKQILKEAPEFEKIIYHIPLKLKKIKHYDHFKDEIKRVHGKTEKYLSHIFDDGSEVNKDSKFNFDKKGKSPKLAKVIKKTIAKKTKSKK